MWLNLSDGFLSIVAHRHKPDHLLVRARKREHLMDNFPDVEMYIDRLADYPYRADVLREDVAQFLTEYCDSMQYDNFKGSVKDDEYHRILVKIWSIIGGYGERYRPTWGVNE